MRRRWFGFGVGLLLLWTTGAATGKGPDLKFAAYLEPGQDFWVLLETDGVHVRHVSPGAAVRIEARDTARNEVLLENVTKSLDADIPLNQTQRLRLTWENPGPGVTRVLVELEGKNVVYLDSHGLREVPPDAWRVPAGSVFAALAALFVAAAAGGRRSA